MLEPTYLQRVPDAMVELYAKAESDILVDMARRINGYDMFIPSAQHQLQMLEEMGAVREEIVGQLTKLTGKSAKELEEIMREAGIEAIHADDVVYRAAGLSSVPLSASPAMKRVLQEGMDKTVGLFENLTKTTANTASRQFELALDAAYMQVTSGAFDPSAAVESAVKALCKQGIQAVEYPSGHRDSIEVAVRRAVITGVNQTALGLQEVRADELGVDLVETTAHAGARPEHVVWQGKIFSRSGKSAKYPHLVSATGYGTGAGLGGWNCSHSMRPYIDGQPRMYTEKMLDGYRARDYEYQGQKLTEYEVLQRQREIERNIRRWKRENIAMTAIGKDATQSAGKIRQWQAAQKDLLEQTGLKRQQGREQVPGWGRSQAGKAGHDARVLQKMEQDAILKAGSTLPKKLTLPDTPIKSTVQADFAGWTATVPRGATATGVYAMAGAGTRNTIDDWRRLYGLYGGDPTQYQKMSGDVVTENFRYIIHWYECSGRQVEHKIVNTKGVRQ